MSERGVRPAPIRGDGNGSQHDEILHLRAYEMRIAGETTRAIGAHLGVDQATVHRWVTRLIRESVKESGDELARIAIERLDGLIRHAVALLTHPDPKVQIAASQQMLRVEERRARMLGLDEPDRHEVQVTVLTPEEKALQDLIYEQKARNRETERQLKEES